MAKDKKVDMVEAVNTEIKNLKDDLDVNKNNQKKLEKESEALAKEEKEKSDKLAGMQELKPSGKPIKKELKKSEAKEPVMRMIGGRMREIN